MNGVGYYDNRAYFCSPPPSNLSAFAQPFSVIKPTTTNNDVSAPCVNLAESNNIPPLNQFPLPSHPYGYDFMGSVPSSEPYGYSLSQLLDPPSTAHLPTFSTRGLPTVDTFGYEYDQANNNVKSSLFEAQSYYPSYVLPPTHAVNPPMVPDHWSYLEDIQKKSEIGFSGPGVGVWNQFGEFNHGNNNGAQVEAGSGFFPEEANVAGPVIEENLVNQGMFCCLPFFD